MSGAKKRQTQAKATRERMVKDRRALKQAKKDARNEAAAAARANGSSGVDAGEPEAEADENVAWDGESPPVADRS